MNRLRSTNEYFSLRPVKKIKLAFSQLNEIREAIKKRKRKKKGENKRKRKMSPEEVPTNNLLPSVRHIVTA